MNYSPEQGNINRIVSLDYDGTGTPTRSFDFVNITEIHGFTIICHEAFAPPPGNSIILDLNHPVPAVPIPTQFSAVSFRFSGIFGSGSSVVVHVNLPFPILSQRVLMTDQLGVHAAWTANIYCIERPLGSIK